MNRRELLIGGAAITGATAVGAVAFTTATVDRDLSIEVTSDEQGIIGLTPGDVGAVNIVDGILTIDMSTDLTDGLNPDAEFYYGSSGEPTTTYAFSITNNDDEARDFTLSLGGFEFEPPAELQLLLYQDDDSLIGDLSPDTSQTTTLAAGESAYVHIDVNTEGLGEDEDMSGTLTIDVQ